MRTLVDFINHGTLPFTGRHQESERLIRFFDEGRESQGLQTLLLLGEAGVGKSRLIEDVIERIKRIGGSVLHAKLYPESPTSIVPLLAGALWRFVAANPTLKVEADETLVSVVGAMRRLARLRRLVLVVEDVHLVEGSGIGDLGGVLDALADEQITVLALARPVELASRGVLERHLVEEIELNGLSRDDIGELWRTLFGELPAENLRDALAEVTAGNPLAIRSALRGALKSGAIVFDEGEKRWMVTMSIDALSNALDRNVRLLSQGMAAHLSPQEAQAAARIASLGELVARETVAMMIEGDDSILEKLIFKGILKTTLTPVRNLAGDRSSQPILAFTHSLLHRQFVESAEFDPSHILRILASSTPLYSVTPFQALVDKRPELEGTLPEVRRAIERGLLVAENLDLGPDWHLAMTVWQSAAQLHETFQRLFSASEWREFRARILISYSSLFHRGEESQKLESLNELLQITENPEGETMLRYRLAALVNMSLYRYVTASHQPDLVLRQQIEEFVENHPQLRFTSVYRAHLSQISMAASLVGDNPTLLALEQRMEVLLSSPEADDECRRELKRAMRPDFLMLFDTEEGLSKRLAMLPELESITDDIYYSGILFCKIQLFEQIGWMREVIDACREATPYFRARSLLLNVYFAERVELCARASFGGSLGSVAEEARKICSTMHPSYAELQQSHMGYQLLSVGILRGDVAWGRAMFEEFTQGRISLPLERLILLEGMDGDLVGILRKRSTERDGYTDAHRISLDNILCSIGALLDTENADAEQEAMHGFMGLLAMPLLTFPVAFTTLAAIDLLDAAVAKHTDREELVVRFKEPVVHLSERLLGWFADRGLHLFMRTLLSRMATYFSRKELNAWRTRIEEVLQLAPTVEQPDRAASKLRLSMLGKIEIQRPSEEPIRPRGVRLRSLLGVMVADQMLERRLGQREFYRLAVSDADDFDDARKTLNLAVHRLRETLGFDAISTDGDTPQLNLDVVEVDLLQVDSLLAGADRGVREGNFHRSTSPFIEALDICRGEVPFPTLYEEFFEAAREDFENRIRSQALRLARGLLREGDAGSAEELLRRAVAAIPEDEELIELLRESLLTLGKRTEAERLMNN
jgi:hypothetical protein